MCFQYTPPTTAAEYVHRVGRTARIGGRGSSLIFLTPAETAFINELANHNIRCALVVTGSVFVVVHLLVLTLGAGLVSAYQK